MARSGCTRMPNGHPPRDTNRYGFTYGQSNLYIIPGGHKSKAEAPAPNIKLSFSVRRSEKRICPRTSVSDTECTKSQDNSNNDRGSTMHICSLSNVPRTVSRTVNQRPSPVESQQPPRTHTRGLPRRIIPTTLTSNTANDSSEPVRGRTTSRKSCQPGTPHRR